MNTRAEHIGQAIKDLEHAQAFLEGAVGALIRGGASALVTRTDDAWGLVDKVRADAEEARRRAEGHAPESATSRSR